MIITLVMISQILSNGALAGQDDKVSVAQQTETIVDVTDFGDISLRLNPSNVTTRYRYQTNASGDQTKNLAEYRVLFDMDVLFWDGKVTVNLNAGTGENFGDDFADLGWGENADDVDADFDGRIFLKRFSISATPKEGITITGGSMGSYYGAGTSFTYLHDAGYIMGFRGKAVMDKGELVVTFGNMGDINEPSVFKRFDRLDEINYIQAAITRKIGEMLKGTIEYDHMNDNDFARGALALDLKKWTSFVDTLTVEDMINVTALTDEEQANVFATTLSKKMKDLMWNRDLNAAFTYSYRENTADGFGTLGTALGGNSVRLLLEVPDVYESKHFNVGTYVRAFESLDDFDEFRGEGGLAIKF